MGNITQKELRGLSGFEIARAINHIEILLDMDYALPDSVIQESDDGKGYHFSYKNKKEFLTKEQAEKLLLILKVLEK